MLAATWSPGHSCCCQGRTTDPGPSISGCLVSQDLADPDSGCCSSSDAAAQPRLRMSMEGGCSGVCDPSAPGDEDSCGCVDAPNDAAPPNGCAVLAAGKHVRDTVDLLTALPPALAEVGVALHRVSTCRGSPGGKPPQSLYALRCLLTM